MVHFSMLALTSCLKSCASGNRQANKKPATAGFLGRCVLSAQDAAAAADNSQVDETRTGTLVGGETDAEAAEIEIRHAFEGLHQLLARQILAGSLDGLDHHLGGDVRLDPVVGVIRALLRPASDADTHGRPVSCR